MIQQLNKCAPALPPNLRYLRGSEGVIKGRGRHTTRTHRPSAAVLWTPPAKAHLTTIGQQCPGKLYIVGMGLKPGADAY